MRVPVRSASRRNLVMATVAATALAFAAACSPGDGAGTSRQVGSDLDEITRLAQEEGRVHLIAYPEDWAGYRESFRQFTEAYGVEVEVSSPEASSAEELTAAQNLRGQASQPDVLDIGYSFTGPATEQGLLDTYVPTVIDEVPSNLKDPDGRWVGAYYGVLSIGVNANLVDVPTSFEDLFDEQYRGKINACDPRQGAACLAAVSAAALARGGSLDDITPGVDYFAELAEGGYLVNNASNAAALETGEAAVTFDWNYNYTGIQDTLAAAQVDLVTVVPDDGVFGNYYAQPVTVDSPQPNAGRLWIEWLLSDAGAKVYAQAGAVPARYEAMVAAGTMPDELIDSLPKPEILDQITFPTQEQGDAANQVVASTWGPRVANR